MFIQTALVRHLQLLRITVTGDKNVRMSSVAKYPICMLQSHPALHHTTPLLQANSRQSASHSTTPSLSRSAALQGGRGESSTLAELQSFPGWDWGCTESPTEVTLKIRFQTPLTVMEPCLISHLNCKYFTPQHQTRFLIEFSVTTQTPNTQSFYLHANEEDGNNVKHCVLRCRLHLVIFQMMRHKFPQCEGKEETCGSVQSLI